MKNIKTLILTFSVVFTFLPAGAQSNAILFEDVRDGRQYKLVTIDDQVWMAENLDYGDEQKTCFNNDPADCEIYGGLYTWEVAQEICPAGWHLPTMDEWKALSDYLGIDDAGQKIKSSSLDSIPWDGTNESGFTAISAGAGNGKGFHRKGDWALFWSASEYSEQRAWFAQLDGYWYEQPPKYKNIYLGWYYLKINQFSVRCVKDQTQ